MSKEKRKPAFLVFGICIIIILFSFPVVYTASLNAAIKDNSEVKVRWLLKLRGDINRHNSLRIVEFVGNTPLQQACIQGNPEIIRMLIGMAPK